MIETLRRTRHRLLASAALVLALLLTLPAPARAQAVQAFETPGGIKVWLVEERSIPLVSVRFAFAGGALHDPAGKEGLASLMAALLTEGAGNLDSDAFARRLADEGTQLAISGSRDRITGGLDALAERLPTSLDLLALALAEPSFETSAIERAREQRVAELEAARTEPRRVAFERWWAETFPNDPRGRPSDGTTTSIAAITRGDIVALHRRLLTRDALRVVVVGAIARADATSLVDRAFARLPASAPERTTIASAAPRSVAAPVVVQLPSAVATVAFGGPVPRVDDADYPALRVLAQVIGSGDFDSTLMEEIRVKRGLAYAVSTSLIVDSSASVMLGGMATEPQKLDDALALLRRVLAEVATKGPTADQVDAARSHLVGSSALDIDSNAKLAGFLLKAWTEGRGPDALATRVAGIERTTLDDVKRVAAKWLAPERLNFTLVVPAK